MSAATFFKIPRAIRLASCTDIETLFPAGYHCHASSLFSPGRFDDKFGIGSEVFIQIAGFIEVVVHLESHWHGYTKGCKEFLRENLVVRQGEMGPLVISVNV